MNNINYENKVFLGGTCGGSTWRAKLISMLNPNVDFFNPQMTHGRTPEGIDVEGACKKVARFNLFVITGDSPSTYSFFEIAEELHNLPERVIFAPLGDLPQISRKSIKIIENTVLDKGGRVFKTLEDLAEFLNDEYEKMPTIC